MFDLRISHTNYSVILGHLSLFLCFKICEHPQGTNALLGMIRNTVWLFSVILLFCTYSFGMYFLLLPSRTFLLVLAHYNQFICIFKDPDSYSPWVSHSPQLCNFYILNICFLGTSLLIQCLRLYIPNAGGLGSISGQGIDPTSHIPQLRPSTAK